MFSRSPSWCSCGAVILLDELALWLRDRGAPAPLCMPEDKAEGVGILLPYIILLMTLLFGYENIQRWDERIIYTQFLNLIYLFTFIPKCSSSMFKPKQGRFHFKNWLWYSSHFCLEWIALHPANSLCYTVHTPQTLSSDTRFDLSITLPCKASIRLRSSSVCSVMEQYSVNNWGY